jgi:hypothetical protein|tara:strand:- start:15285 stop:15485 length:201 start_codon:yes stop_codon:yes gene_type:complete
MKRVNFKHLDEVALTYFEHLRQALFISLYMILGGFACLIHAFFPFVFWETASNTIKKILKDIPNLL